VNLDGNRSGWTPDKGIRWRRTGAPWYSWKRGPTFRPDFAATVATSNCARMVEVAASHGWGSSDSDLLMMHVDACWIRGDPEVPPDFAIKSRGRFRGYAVGCYQHGEVRKASGLPTYGRTPTIEEIERFAAATRIGSDSGQRWTGRPAESPDAIALPAISATESATVRDPTWARHLWSAAGWRTDAKSHRETVWIYGRDPVEEGADVLAA